MPLPGLEWPGGKEEDNENGQKSGTGAEGVKDAMGRWSSFSLSEIVFCRIAAERMGGRWAGIEWWCAVSVEGWHFLVVLYIDRLLAAPSFLTTSSHQFSAFTITLDLKNIEL